MKITTSLSKEKTQRAKTILLLCFSCLCLFSSTAQTIYVLKKDNADTPINIKNIESINFREGDCIIKNTEGSTNSFDINNIKYLSFVNYKLVDIAKEIEDNNTAEISCYPNPASSFLNVKLSQDLQGGNIKIISTSGQVMLKEIGSKELQTINIAALKQGLYLCKITTDKAVETKPFIKK